MPNIMRMALVKPKSNAIVIRTLEDKLALANNVTYWIPKSAKNRLRASLSATNSATKKVTKDIRPK